MRCPFCGFEDTQVKDSRPSEDNAAIRRRRFCPECDARFTTFERVQLRELIVIKSDGTKKPFDRDKLARSMRIALRKRPVDEDKLEQVINGLVRQMETTSDGEMSTKEIGQMVKIRFVILIMSLMFVMPLFIETFVRLQISTSLLKHSNMMLLLDRAVSCSPALFRT